MTRARHMMRRLQSAAGLIGVDLRRVYALRNAGRFIRDSLIYRRHHVEERFPLRLTALMPVLSDYDGWAGGTGNHYFHQDLWAARRIFQARPAHHVDVGSRIDGFVAHVLTFMPVTAIDVRPLESCVAGLAFLQDDATDLRRLAGDSVESLSSLHAVEHFGLGRYGDPVDPDACFKAMSELARILRPGGRLYFAVPIGRERLEFNAHRVFGPATVLAEFRRLTLISFSAVDDDGRFHESVDPGAYSQSWYACGLFEFTK